MSPLLPSRHLLGSCFRAVLSTSVVASATAYQFGDPADLTYALDDPADVRALDVDGDGNEDLIVTEGARVLLFLGDGMGEFAEPELLGDDTGGPTRMHLGDVDGDGVDDLLTVERDAGEVRWFRGLASGGFDASVTIAVLGESARSIELGDVIGNALPDLVAAVPLDGLFVVQQLAPGLFGAPTRIGTPTLRPTDVAVDDIDLDGDLDVLFGARAPQRLSWLPSNGNGTFGNERLVGFGLGDAIDVDLVDVDADGDRDGVVVWIGTGVVDWHENLGNGHLSIGVPLVVGLDRPIDAVVRDLDGDLDLDVLVAIAGEGRLRWSEGLGGGVFGLTEAFGSGFGAPRVAEAGDFDGDGLADAVTVTHRGALVVHDNQGAMAPRFGPTQEITRLARGAVDSSLVDLDGDGDLDALVAETAAGRTIWFENEGDVEFGEQQVVSTGLAGVARVLGTDADGDGIVDVVGLSFSTGVLSLALGQGAGAYAPAATIDTLAAVPVDLALADLDSDGADDLVVATDVGDTVWYENLGAGAFAPARVVAPAPGQPTAIALGDVDDDGAVDVGLALAGGQSVSWYRNLGGGAFGPAQDASGPVVDPVDATFADLDADGTLDVLWTVGGSTDVAWARGRGAGSFDTPTPLSAGVPGPGRSITVADVDLDGELDIVATFDPPPGFASLYVAIHLGNGLFAPFAPVASSIRDASRMAVGDLDGDGDPEILLPRSASDTVTRLDNETVAFLGTNYCGPSVPNVAGLEGRMSAIGSLAVQDNRVTLRADRLPPNVFGLFITSQTQMAPSPVPGGLGLLCLGGSIGRFIAPGLILSADATGRIDFDIDLTALPTPFGPVAAVGGETWNFQAWHRDSAAGMPSSNFTDGLAVTWE